MWVLIAGYISGMAQLVDEVEVVVEAGRLVWRVELM